MDMYEWATVVAAVFVAIAGFGLSWWRYRRSTRHRTDVLAQQDQRIESQSLLAEIRAQGAAIQTFANALDRLQQQLSLDARHVASPARGGRASYELAIRLAHSAASIDEICASCGMSRAEAELVCRLHRDGNSPASSRRLALAV